MVDHPDNFAPRMLRRLDSERDHVVDELGELKTHVGRLERALATAEVSIAEPSLPMSD
jgi:hypothetical protein